MYRNVLLTINKVRKSNIVEKIITPKNEYRINTLVEKSLNLLIVIAYVVYEVKTIAIIIVIIIIFWSEILKIALKIQETIARKSTNKRIYTFALKYCLLVIFHWEEKRSSFISRWINNYLLSFS